MKITGPIALASVEPVPWKNGGGTTRTLAVAPQGAGLDDFHWRVSMAQIDASGDFSAFPGVERTILLWRGGGVLLQSPQWPEHALTEPLRPFHFRGEDAVRCRLLGPAAMDLNLMVRRGASNPSLSCHATAVEFSGPCEELLVLCAVDSVRVLLPGGAETALAADQLLRVEQVPAGSKVIPSNEEARFVCVTVLGEPQPTLPIVS
jgi:uncharacterized protein